MVRSRRAMEIRRIRSWLSLNASVVLIPWIVYLAFTLPQNYVAQHWRVAWVGFDVLLLTFMIATAVVGFLHHRLLTNACRLRDRGAAGVRRVVRHHDGATRRHRRLRAERGDCGAAAGCDPDRRNVADRATGGSSFSAVVLVLAAVRIFALARPQADRVTPTSTRATTSARGDPQQW